VLLVGGISIVMQSLLGISNITALLITLVFVTGYVFVGGTYAHVLTNVLQGTLMIGVTILILAACVKLAFSGSVPLAEQLRLSDPNLLQWVKSDGLLFNDWYSVFVAGFVVGAVIVCQPHILTKALYVKTDLEVRQYLIVFGIIFLLFQLLGTVGFFAHIAVPEPSLIDLDSRQFRQDLVMTMFLKSVFPEWVFTIVSIVLLAAAMSTLDGLLVSMSTITANDLVLNVFAADPSVHPEQRMALALKVSHVVLVFIAIAAFLINLHPPRLLCIFGQVGVYGLTAAAAPPLLLGVLFRNVPLGLVWIGSAAALTIHFGLFFFGNSLFPGLFLTFSNPGVTASIASLLVIPLLIAVSFGLNRIR
jgi:SSS family solute:Na+ symporter/sodium/pantothenate symporter